MNSFPALQQARAAFLQANRDPVATIEFSATRAGVLCGITQVLAVLRAQKQRPLQVWTLDEGAPLAAGEVALRVRGHFLEYGFYAPELAGRMAQASGWASAARRLVDAAHPLPVCLLPDLQAPPEFVAQIESAALAGGCAGPNSPLSRGVLPRSLILLFGDTVRAAQAWKDGLPPNVPHLAAVDTFYPPAREAVRVALALGNRLAGVVLRVPNALVDLSPAPEPEPNANKNKTAEISAFAELLQALRQELDLAGFPRLQVYLDGAITPESILQLAQRRAPIDGYLVADSVAAAPPLLFAAEIKESEGRPLARRGVTAGTTPNPGLKKIELG